MDDNKFTLLYAAPGVFAKQIGKKDEPKAEEQKKDKAEEKKQARLERKSASGRMVALYAAPEFFKNRDKRAEADIAEVYAGPEFFEKDESSRRKPRGKKEPIDPALISAVYAGPDYFEGRMSDAAQDADYPRNYEEEDESPAPAENSEDDVFMKSVYAGPEILRKRGKAGSTYMLQVYAAPVNASPEELWRAVNKPVDFCPNCGTPVTKGDRFCRECGNKLPGWDKPVNV